MNKVLQRVAVWLDEAVMGFLALAAVAVAMIPVLFAVDAEVEGWLTIAEWTIVLFFAVEYAVNLALADDRAAFVVDLWRLLDLFVIAGLLLTLLPQITNT